MECERQSGHCKGKTVVEIEELESQLGPDETDVDFRRILEEARDEEGVAIFETFSTDGPSAFLAVSRSRWDKDQKRLNAPWRQNSSACSSERQWQEGLEGKRVGWTPSERRVMVAGGNYLDNCVHMKMDNEVLERLMEPENEEVSLRYILKFSTRKGSNTHQLFNTLPQNTCAELIPAKKL